MQPSNATRMQPSNATLCKPSDATLGCNSAVRTLQLEPQQNNPNKTTPTKQVRMHIDLFLYIFYILIPLTPIGRCRDCWDIIYISARRPSTPARGIFDLGLATAPRHQALRPLNGALSAVVLRPHLKIGAGAQQRAPIHTIFPWEGAHLEPAPCKPSRSEGSNYTLM